MKLRNRLTLISSLIFGITFTIASALIYIFYYDSSTSFIYKQLERICLITANFYLEKDEMSPNEYGKVREQLEDNIQNIEVRVYSEKNQIEYGEQSTDPHITAELLNRVREENSVNFRHDYFYYSGIYYHDNQGDYVIFLKEDNQVFHEQTNRLLFILLGVFVIGILTIFFLSRFLSGLAYRPITRVIDQVNAIEPESLSQPIQLPGTHDELEDLIITFNNLLVKLSDTFTIQRNFIKYVSHEFKTPLTVIAGNLEVLAQKKRSPEEYENVAKQVVQNVYYIEKILNSLIMIAGLKHDESTSKTLRIDEVLWETIDNILQVYPQDRLSVNMDVPPEKEPLLTIKGNYVEVQMSIYNLLDNAIKYSEGKKVAIHLIETDGKIVLTIKDQGKGIPSEELSYVQKPFYRGSNIQKISGSGVGLSLAVIIFKQNNIQFEIDSVLNVGTTIRLTFPVFHANPSPI